MSQQLPTNNPSLISKHFSKLSAVFFGLFLFLVIGAQVALACHTPSSYAYIAPQSAGPNPGTGAMPSGWYQDVFPVTGWTANTNCCWDPCTQFDNFTQTNQTCQMQVSGPNSYSATEPGDPWITISYSGDGMYTVNASVWGGQSNTGGCPGSEHKSLLNTWVSFGVDRNAPATPTINYVPSTGSPTPLTPPGGEYIAPANFSFSNPSSGGSPMYTQYSLNSGTWTDANTLTISNPGTYTLKARTRDEAGHISPETQSYTIVVFTDSQGPTASFTSLLNKCYDATAWGQINPLQFTVVDEPPPATPTGLSSTAPTVRVSNLTSGGSTDYTAVNSAPSISNSSLATSLMGYWRLDESSGTRFDSTANGNHLTPISGPTSTTGRINNGINLVKSSAQYLSAPNSASLTTGAVNYTVAGWFKLATKNDYRRMAGKDNNTGYGGVGEGVEWGLNYNPAPVDRFSFGIWNFNAGVTANSLGAPNIDTWYFIVAWVDLTTEPSNHKMCIKINNGPTDCQPIPGNGNPIATNGGFYLGNLHPSRSLAYTFDGVIDEFGFWKRLLTNSEITALYNNGNGIPYTAPPSSSWQLDLPFNGLTLGQKYSAGIRALDNAGNASANCGGSVVIGSNLAAFYNMEETTGSTINDSVYSHHGAGNAGVTLGAANSGVNSSGRSITLNGAQTGFVNIPDSTRLDSSPTMTISAWLKTTNTGNMGIISKGTGTGTQYAIYTQNGSIYCTQSATAGNFETNVSATLPATFANGNWHHIACVNNGTQAQLYFDSNPIATADSSPATTFLPSTESLTIGRSSIGSTTYFTGSIDQVGIWNRGLNSLEIESLYNSTRGLSCSGFTGTTEFTANSVCNEPYIQVQQGNVHSNSNINIPGGPAN